MAHWCHATGCKKHTSAAMIMCKVHWYKLPYELRKGIWAYYWPGQEDGDLTDDYCFAAKECIEYIAKLEGVEPDTSLYDAHLEKINATKKVRERSK